MQIATVGRGVTFPDFPQEQTPVFSGSRFRETLTSVLTGGGSTHSKEQAVREIDNAAADIQNISLAFNKLKFVVDHESQEVLVKVIDPETDKVIKTLPPKELQRLHHKIKEAMGILFDEEV